MEKKKPKLKRKLKSPPELVDKLWSKAVEDEKSLPWYKEQKD
jgi:hypothetical protein